MKTMIGLLSFAVAAGVMMVSDARAQDVFELSYGMKKGDVLMYNGSVATTTVQQRMGEEMKNTVTVNTTQKWVVENVAADGAIAIITSPEKIAIDAPGMQEGRRGGPGGRMDADAVKEMIGKRTRIVITPSGDVVSQQALDAMPGGRRGGMLKAMRFVALPERAVAIGDTWKSTGVDTINVGFSQALAKYTLTWTAASKEQHAGRECVKITYEGRQTLSGQGEMRGTSFSLEGAGKIAGAAWFDYAKGVIVEEESTTEQQAVIAMTGEREMTMPVTQATRAWRRLIIN